MLQRSTVPNLHHRMIQYCTYDTKQQYSMSTLQDTPAWFGSSTPTTRFLQPLHHQRPPAVAVVVKHGDQQNDEEKERKKNRGLWNLAAVRRGVCGWQVADSEQAAMIATLVLYREVCPIDTAARIPIIYTVFFLWSVRCSNALTYDVWIATRFG